MNTGAFAILTAIAAALLSYRLYSSDPIMSLQVEERMMKDDIMQSSMFVNAGVVKDVEKIQKIATMDVPALASQKSAWAMAWLHLVVWNAWKSTYYYASKHPSNDFDNYKSYALMSFNYLVAHHDAEESTIFPALEAKLPGSMKKNEEQHHAFLGPIEDAIKYLQTSTASSFDAKTFRTKIDSFLGPVMEHLAEELDTLEASKLLPKFSEAELAALNKASHTAQTKGTSSAESLPFVLQNLPPGSPFPPAPKFVTGILGPWAFYWKLASLWKYTAYPWKPSL